MSDLVERLRLAYEFCKNNWSGDELPEKDSAADLCREAADEIERLRSEKLKCACHSHDCYDCWRSRYRMLEADADQVRTDGGPCECSCHYQDEDERL